VVRTRNLLYSALPPSPRSFSRKRPKNPPAKNFTAEQFYDNSLVQELINENVFKALWGK